MALAASVGAHALEPSRTITQYRHTTWRAIDGHFTGTPSAVEQTADGYIWLGTDAGLTRFDGERFEPIVRFDLQANRPASGASAATGVAASSLRVVSLKSSADGSLWIGTQTGLVQLKNGRFKPFDGVNGFVNGLAIGQDGAVWVAQSRSDTSLCRVQASSVKCLRKADGLAFEWGEPVLAASDGSTWVGSADSLARINGNAVETIQLPNGASSHEVLGVQALANSPDGGMWVGALAPNGGSGLLKWRNGKWESPTIAGFDGKALQIQALHVDRHGALWIGTLDRGLYRVQDGRAERFSSADGLSSDSVHAVFEDAEGNIWVATSKGLDAFSNLPVASFSIREGLSNDFVHAVSAAPDGSLWINNITSLDRLAGGKISSLPLPAGSSMRNITGILSDSRGRVWVGVDDSLTELVAGKFNRLTFPDGTPVGVVVGLVENSSGSVFVVTDKNRFVRVSSSYEIEDLTKKVPEVAAFASDGTGGLWLGATDGDVFHYVDGGVKRIVVRHSAARRYIRTILLGPHGSIIGATSEGLIAVQGDEARLLTADGGLSCSSLSAAAFDHRGDLWLNSACGIQQIAKGDLEQWLDKTTARVEVSNLDATDGAIPQNTYFQPKAAVTSDGRLWFATGSQLQMVDPEHLAKNTVVPQVHIETLTADRVHYAIDSRLKLPAGVRSIEFEYMATSYSAPRKVQFRYRLEGYDTDWRDAGNRRTAAYTNLAPGRYQFRVIASNNDGLWNEAGAAVALDIPPTFAQTKWFLVLCALAGLALIAFGIHIRLRQLSKRLQLRIEERADERVRIARELHDTLHQSTQSMILAFEGLVRDEHVDPVRHARLKNAVNTANKVAQEGRSRIEGLRLSPEFAQRDIVQTLTKLAEDIVQHHPVELNVESHGQSVNVDPFVTDAVCRIARESIINALLHAKASSITLSIRNDPERFVVTVRDDGTGIDPKLIGAENIEGHWGLKGMRERATQIGAHLTFSSHTGSGTTVELTLPASIAYIGGKYRLPWLRRWLR